MFKISYEQAIKHLVALFEVYGFEGTREDAKKLILDALLSDDLIAEYPDRDPATMTYILTLSIHEHSVNPYTISIFNNETGEIHTYNPSIFEHS